MKIIKGLLVTAVIGTMVSCGKQRKQVSSLETELDSVSYAVGLNIGLQTTRQFKNGFEEVDKEVFIQGFLNGADSLNLLMDEKDIAPLLNNYFQKKQQAEAKKRAEEAKRNKEEGEAFLAENKTKEGVITTESGLQYTVLKEGTGKRPTEEDKVKVHYHGTLIDGTVFQSTVEEGKPTSFGVKGVIAGWTEGLQLMKEGAKYKFFIPSDLAYGPQQRSEKIKGNSTLIFEIELLEILDK